MFKQNNIYFLCTLINVINYFTDMVHSGKHQYKFNPCEVWGSHSGNQAWRARQQVTLICWYLSTKLHSSTSQTIMLKFKPISGQNRIDEHQQLYSRMSRWMHQSKLRGGFLRTCHKSSNQSIGRDRHSSYEVLPHMFRLPAQSTRS
jgi:hypothetical protein